MTERNRQAHDLIEWLHRLQYDIRLKTGMSHAITELQVSDDYALALGIIPGSKVVLDGVVVQADVPDLSHALTAREIECERLRAALTEALDNWERAEIDVITSTDSEAMAKVSMANSAELARIAELRAKFLGGKK